jgi:hypothetical protein
VLRESHAGSPEAQRAGHEALRDPDAEVRLAGTTLLGDEAADPLLAMASDEKLDADVRVRAVEQLESQCSRTVAAPRLEALLGCLHPEVRVAALASMQRAAHVPALALLVATLPALEPESATALAELLGRHASASAEGLLLALFERDEPDTKIAAARALARVGTIAAVEHLHAYTRGLSVESELRTSAREAIAAIQARLGDVEAGRLALADVSGDRGALSPSLGAGAVSLAGSGDARDGALSVDVESGNLSLEQVERKGDGALSVPSPEEDGS